MPFSRVPGDANLYIGGLFSLRAKEALKAANITHIISALTPPIDEDLVAGYQHLVVDVDDVEDENLLEWFPRVVEWIREGLRGGGGVLVHCLASKSRSATLLLAFLLHTHPHLTPRTALSLLRQAHPLAEPNPGFMAQLHLYHRMGCPSSLTTQPLYQRWLNERAGGESVAVGAAPGEGEVRYGDELGASEKDSDGTDGGGTLPPESSFRCRRCRTPLATSNFLIPHSPPSSKTTTTTTTTTTDLSISPSCAPISSLPLLSSNTPPKSQQCTHLFLDPLAWMRPELSQGKLEGRLECPKCRQNVGKYAWQGMRCSCGGWVVPGISLGRGRVDEVKGLAGRGRRVVGGLGGRKL